MQQLELNFIHEIVFKKYVFSYNSTCNNANYTIIQCMCSSKLSSSINNSYIYTYTFVNPVISVILDVNRFQKYNTCNIF